MLGCWDGISTSISQREPVTFIPKTAVFLISVHHLLHPLFSPFFVVVQLLSCVWLFATPGTVALQVPLSSTISQNLFKFMSIESVVLFNHLILYQPLFLLPSIFPSIRVFFNESVIPIRCPSIGVSAPASVLPMNIQGWFPLGLTSLTSLLPKGLSGTTIQKHQFFGTQLSLWPNSRIGTWILEKPQLWLCGLLAAKWCFCFLICWLGLS